MSELLHGEEERAYGDSGYIGANKRPEAIKKNKNGKKIKYLINRRPSSIKKLSKSGQYAAKKKEHQKSSVRCHKKYFSISKDPIPRSAKTDCEIEYDVRIGESVSGCQKISGSLIQCTLAMKIECFSTHSAFGLGAFCL